MGNSDSSPIIHTFNESDARQRPYAAKFELWYPERFGAPLRKATLAEEMSGKDYFSGPRSLQLKTDFASDKPTDRYPHGTGNFFVEMEIENRDGRVDTWGSNLSSDEYWFLRPLHMDVVVLSARDLGLLIEEHIRSGGRLRGPVMNRNPNTGDTWRAFGYAIGVRKFHEAGKVFEIAP